MKTNKTLIDTFCNIYIAISGLLLTGGTAMYMGVMLPEHPELNLWLSILTPLHMLFIWLFIHVTSEKERRELAQKRLLIEKEREEILYRMRNDYR